MRKVLSLVLVALLAIAVPASALAVVPVDGGNDWVVALAVDPANPFHAYAATAYLSDPPGAFFATTDYGRTWDSVAAPSADAYPFMVGALATTGQVVWAAQHYDVLHSQDGGVTWRKALVDESRSFTDAWVDPGNPSRVVVASTDSVEGPTPFRLHRSDNAGSSWTASVIPLAGSTVHIDVSGAENQEVVAGAYDCCGTGGGAVLSHDGGATWDAPLRVGQDVYDVEFDPAHPGWVYAVFEIDGVCRSTDGGATWATVFVPPAEVRLGSIEIAPDGLVCIGGSAGDGARAAVYVSRDGVQFKDISPSGEPGIGEMAMDGSGCSVYCGTIQGVFRTWVGRSARVAGVDRFQTAIEVSKRAFETPGSARSAVICTAFNFPDAIAAAPYAAYVEGPVLLADSTKGLSEATLAELRRVVEPGRTVYLIGGPDVVPESVRAQLADYKVIRASGPTRYETAVEVANRIAEPTAVFVAVGTNFPDALCASPPASGRAAPILFVKGQTLHPAVKAYIASHPTIDSIFIVGDKSVVTQSVENELRLLEPNISRYGGATRYDTSLAITRAFYPDKVPVIGLASGEDFPDALAGAVLCALESGPLMITKPSGLVLQVADYLDDRAVDEGFVFGGTGALSEFVQYDFEASMR